MDSTINERSPQNPSLLSEATLAQQNESHVVSSYLRVHGMTMAYISSQYDDNYATGLIQQETNQSHAQRLREEGHEVTACDEESCDHHEVVTNDEDIAEVTKLYKLQKSSNATPMERMATMSTAEAPFAVGEKLAMDGMGIERGSLKSASHRHKAAVDAAGHHVQGGLTFRRANSMTTTRANHGSNIRVSKKARVNGRRKISKAAK
jgi:hypothetical protein